jgi:hypothetical protein
MKTIPIIKKVEIHVNGFHFIREFHLAMCFVFFFLPKKVNLIMKVFFGFGFSNPFSIIDLSMCLSCFLDVLSQNKFLN